MEDSSTGSSADNATADEGLVVEIDQVFGLLQNRRRRDVLRYLAEESERVRLGELAEHIAARECEKDVSQITSQERKRVYVALYQCHLPKMADVDAVTYDKSRGTIERGPNFDVFRHYLPDEDATEATGTDYSWAQSLVQLLT